MHFGTVELAQHCALALLHCQNPIVQVPMELHQVRFHSADLCHAVSRCESLPSGPYGWDLNLISHQLVLFGETFRMDCRMIAVLECFKCCQVGI